MATIVRGIKAPHVAESRESSLPFARGMRAAAGVLGGGRGTDATSVRFEPGQTRSVPRVARRSWINLPARGEKPRFRYARQEFFPRRSKINRTKQGNSKTNRGKAGAVPSNRR